MVVGQKIQHFSACPNLIQNFFSLLLHSENGSFVISSIKLHLKSRKKSLRWKNRGLLRFFFSGKLRCCFKHQSLKKRPFEGHQNLTFAANSTPGSTSFFSSFLGSPFGGPLFGGPGLSSTSPDSSNRSCTNIIFSEMKNPNLIIVNM